MVQRRPDPPPHHAETVTLAPLGRIGLWAFTVTLVLPGLVLAVRPAPGSSSAAAGILLTLGAGTAFAARRLAAHETVLTRVSLRFGFGPLSRVVPRHEVGDVTYRPATGWRRLYARQELLLQVRAGGVRRILALPSNDPDSLVVILAGTAHLEPGGAGPYP